MSGSGCQLEVLSLGSGASFQDLGRLGLGRFGVPEAGVMDRFAAFAANRLLGNGENAALLEASLSGLRLRAVSSIRVGIAGACAPRGFELWTAFELKAGDVLDFSGSSRGVWTYVSVPGGFELPHVLGSVSSDPRNGLGRALRVGDLVGVVDPLRCPWDGAVVRRRLSGRYVRDYAEIPRLKLLPGPQFELFSELDRARMVESEWLVSRRVDRTGYRLEGPRLLVPPMIPSEPVIPGSFQISGDGQPVVTMLDGPTVGGYAKIAVLADADRDWLAQAKPGTKLKFQWAFY